MTTNEASSIQVDPINGLNRQDHNPNLGFAQADVASDGSSNEQEIADFMDWLEGMSIRDIVILIRHLDSQINHLFYAVKELDELVKKLIEVEEKTAWSQEAILKLQSKPGHRFELSSFGSDAQISQLRGTRLHLEVEVNRLQRSKKYVWRKLGAPNSDRYREFEEVFISSSFKDNEWKIE